MIQKHLSIDDSKAFKHLLDQVSDSCLQCFKEMISRNKDWFVDTTGTLERLSTCFAIHAKRINEGHFTPEDFIALINYAVMIYNLNYDPMDLEEKE